MPKMLEREKGGAVVKTEFNNRGGLVRRHRVRNVDKLLKATHELRDNKERKDGPLVEVARLPLESYVHICRVNKLQFGSKESLDVACKVINSDMPKLITRKGGKKFGVPKWLSS